MREDPDREGLLYAGTEFGMFISFDNGAHWQPFHLNMPQVPINDIKRYKKDLLVATQGRAFWILDNLSVAAPADAGGHDVGREAVRAARRVSHAGQPGPRSGRCSSTYLPSVPAGPVTIDVLDAKGEVVNTYSSDTPVGGGVGADAGAEAAAGRGRVRRMPRRL